MNRAELRVLFTNESQKYIKKIIWDSILLALLRMTLLIAEMTETTTEVMVSDGYKDKDFLEQSAFGIIISIRIISLPVCDI